MTDKPDLHEDDLHIIEPIALHHDRESFDCGSIPLNDFLQKRALNSMLGSTYVLVSHAGSPEIIAYFTWAPDAIAYLKDNAGSILSGSVKLEYLAVNKKFQGSGIGTDLLVFIMRQVGEFSRISPTIKLFVLEPLDSVARRWFINRNFGFETMYLPDRCLAIAVETILDMDKS